MNLASQEQAARVFQRISDMEAELRRFSEMLSFQSNAIATLEARIANQNEMVAKVYTVIYNGTDDDGNLS